MFDAIIEIKQNSVKSRKKWKSTDKNVRFQIHILNTSNEVVHINKETINWPFGRIILDY